MDLDGLVGRCCRVEAVGRILVFVGESTFWPPSWRVAPITWGDHDDFSDDVIGNDFDDWVSSWITWRWRNSITL